MQRREKMNFTQSIRFRLMLIIASLVVGALVVVSGTSYYFAEKYLGESLDQTEQAVASRAAVQVKNEIDTLVVQLVDLSSIARLQSGDKEQIRPALQEAKQRISVFDDIVFASLDGMTINDKGSVINIADREYFQKVVSTQKSYVSEIFLSRANQKQSIALCVPVIRSGQMIGVLFGTYSLDKLVSIVKDIKYKQKGYGALLDDSGVYLAHPTRPELVGNMNLSTGQISPELQQQLGANAKVDSQLIEAFKETTEKNVRTRVAYKTTTGTSQFSSLNVVPLAGGQRWILLMSTSKDDATSEAASLSMIMLGLSVFCIILALALTFWVSGSFVRPIIRITQIAQDIATGNLKQIEKTITDNSEFGLLSDSIIQMNQNLRGLVQQVQAQASQVAASSEELTASAQQCAEAANQVAGSIAEIAQGTEKQASSANHVGTVAEQMSESTEQVSASAQEVAKITENTAHEAEQGRQAVEQAIDQMNLIGQGSEAVQIAITELAKGSQEISEIVTLISTIAGQTNLLALNAAIEAARAGEHGRGFAVVAEEVRKLAEESNQAAQQIGTLIQKNQANMDQAVAKTQSGAEGVKAGVTVVNSAGETFKNIVGSIMQLSSQIREISQSINRMATDSRTLVSSIHEIDQVSRENSAEAQTVSAATEEQSASMQEIASSSQSLAKLAGDLQEAVAKFRL